MSAQQAEEAPRCAIPDQHTRIHPSRLPADPTSAVLVRLVRQPHRSYPICHVREMPPSRRWERHYSAWDGKVEPYPWCPNSARWQWGEQTLCEEHAAAWALGLPLHGLYPDGRWCRRYAEAAS